MMCGGFVPAAQCIAALVNKDTARHWIIVSAFLDYCPCFETVALVSEEMHIALDGIVFHDQERQTVAKCAADFFAGKSEAKPRKYIDLCVSADKLK